MTSSPATSKWTPTTSPTQASVTSSPLMNIPLCDRSTASATRNSSAVANWRRTRPATFTRGARPPVARLNTARLMTAPLLRGNVAAGARTARNARLLQVALLPQRRFDALARVAHFQARRFTGELLDQLDVAGGKLRAHLVGDVGHRAVALVAALVDEPLPEELLVEHPLVLAAAEPLLAAFGDPVPARVGRVDLVDEPDLPGSVDAE